MSVVYEWRLGQTIDDLSPPVGCNRTRRCTNTDVNTRSYYLFCGNRTLPAPARSPFTVPTLTSGNVFCLFRRLSKIVLHHGAILRFLKQSSTVFLSLARQPSKSHNVPKKTFHDIFHPTTNERKTGNPLDTVREIANNFRRRRIRRLPLVTSQFIHSTLA